MDSHNTDTISTHVPNEIIEQSTGENDELVNVTSASANSIEFSDDEFIAQRE